MAGGAPALRCSNLNSTRRGPANLDNRPVRYNHEKMNFEIIDEIQEVEIIAAGNSIRDRARLKKIYGAGRWRKLKGIANVRLQTGGIRLAELHGYEAHGIGKREIKRKRYLD